YAEAHRTFLSSAIDVDIPLVGEIISKNTSIPLILTDQDGNIIGDRNLDENYTEKDKKRLLEKFKNQNDPIVIELEETTQYLYYGNSPRSEERRVGKECRTR